MMHSQESGSSVFFHSQEEGAGMESWNHSRDSEGCCPDPLVVGREPGGESDTDTGTSVGVMPLSSQSSFCLFSANLLGCVSAKRQKLCGRDDRSPEA